jgi:hypothetical protein
LTISTWFPVSKIITGITQANPGVVTTSQPHGYLNGLYVRIDMQPNPALFGMTQVNGNVYLISVLSNTTFSLNADTSKYDSFIAKTVPQAPQVVPVGEVAFTLSSAERNTLIPYGG